MGGLAALAREAGHRVTGCDTGVYPPMSDQLRALGIELIEGYSAEQLGLKPDMFVVGNVVSRARSADGSPRYPLMEAILEAGLPYTSGPQWLSDHVLHAPGQSRHVLAVAGTHGKTVSKSAWPWWLFCRGWDTRQNNHHGHADLDTGSGRFDAGVFDRRRAAEFRCVGATRTIGHRTKQAFVCHRSR